MNRVLKNGVAEILLSATITGDLLIGNVQMPIPLALGILTFTGLTGSVGVVHLAAGLAQEADIYPNQDESSDQ